MGSLLEERVAKCERAIHNFSEILRRIMEDRDCEGLPKYPELRKLMKEWALDEIFRQLDEAVGIPEPPPNLVFRGNREVKDE